ncbi:MAG: hypothetical protein P8X74_22455 [Reinekea sp.]|jgi:hypothetical protein
MDRMNSNFYGHYYSYGQTNQENGQHASQPEAGQTSTGESVSEAWGSHPEPSRPTHAPEPSSRPRLHADGGRKARADAIKARFLAGLDAYGRGVSLEHCSISIPFERYIDDDGSMLGRGVSLYQSLTETERTQLDRAIVARRGDKFIKDSLAMYGPMQTEAMWAMTWQLTGQAGPGPSASAEPAIPYYGREDVGDDFQHQYGPYGLTAQVAPERLVDHGIVDRMLVNIQGEVYRVHDTERSQGRFVLVPRMQGG